MSNQSKERYAQIRITREEDELIKRYGGIKSDIWRLGFNEWEKKLPQKLEEQAEYYKKMSLQCIDKLKEINVKDRAGKNILDESCLVYIKHERAIPDDPIELIREDRNWIESKIKKQKLNCSIDRFIERCKELKNPINNNNNTL